MSFEWSFLFQHPIFVSRLQYRFYFWGFWWFLLCFWFFVCFIVSSKLLFFSLLLLVSIFCIGYFLQNLVILGSWLRVGPPKELTESSEYTTGDFWQLHNRWSVWIFWGWVLNSVTLGLSSWSDQSSQRKVFQYPVWGAWSPVLREAKWWTELWSTALCF